MPIYSNEAGVLYEHDAELTNDGGVLYEQDPVCSNEGGVLYEIFSGWTAPEGVYWDGSKEPATSYTADKDSGQALTGTFTLKKSTVVTVSGIWGLPNTLYSGSGQAVMYTSGTEIFNYNLTHGSKISYSGELLPGDYTIRIVGGGGSSSGTCGYHANCTVTFSKP